MELQMLTDYELFLFDFDGLLVNTEQLHYQAYLDMLKNHRVEISWTFNEFAALAHTSSTALKNYLAPMVLDTPWDELYEEKQANLLTYLQSDKLELMPGADEMLSFVKAFNIPAAVATNSRREQIEIIKHALLKLNVIEHWITREDYEHPKPAPDAYLTAIKKARPDATAILGFEDSMRGVASLISANVDPILICSPDHPQMAMAKDIPHFESLNAVLKTLGPKSKANVDPRG